MARLAVNLLGGFRASLESGAPCPLPTKKAQALLAYLALDPGRAHPRDALASLLWGDRPDAQARKSLRQTFYALRKAVSGAGDALLLLEGEGIARNPAGLHMSTSVCAVQPGWRKSGGITPTSTNGSPSTSSVLPRAFGSAPRRRRQ